MDKKVRGSGRKLCEEKEMKILEEDMQYVMQNTGETMEVKSSSLEIGLGLIGFGIFFSFLAILLFFDRGLLALGNIFWLTGVALLLGWRSTLQLFTNRMNYKGSISFLLGLFFIFVRWPVVGILVEMYGCIILFGGFWPSIKVFLYQIPVFGWILQYPVLLINQLRRSSG